MKHFTVITFKSDKELSEELKQRLSIDENVRFFSINIYDEYEQLVLQAKKVFVIIDKLESIIEIKRIYKTKHKFRISNNYFDHLTNVPNEKMMVLDDNKVRYIPNDKIEDMITKLELFFFGKPDVLGKTNELGNTGIDKEYINKNAYVTILKKRKNKWRVFASSHMQDEQIDELLNKNFDEFVDYVCHHPKEYEEKVVKELEGSDYTEFIIPIYNDSYVDNIGIFHLKRGPEFDHNVEKLNGFVVNMIYPSKKSN